MIRPPGQSPEVVAVIEVMGSQARTEILRMLSIDGPLTTSEIARRLQIEHPRGAHRHLVDLRDAGFVQSESIDGRGTIRWSVVPEELPRAAQRWLDYASGAAEPQG